ncbi:MAG: TerB family tellurite resistance protein [Spirosomaceae bacterium]|jgi:uncharacterized tellurite resistance protein B-like protein|nr:TerB family tellurite resistance protein [Spirosomataceae bacterium]
MNTPDLYMGLGSAVYALVKADGQLHEEESVSARKLLLEQPHGDLAMQSFQLREHYGTSAEEAYQFAFRRFAANREVFDGELKKQFVEILQKIAEADSRVSGKETDFIKRFRKDLRRI